MSKRIRSPKPAPKRALPKTRAVLARKAARLTFDAGEPRYPSYWPDWNRRNA